MRILILSGLDINGQAAMLSEWLRKNSKHDVTNLVCSQTYLNYPLDGGQTVQLAEAVKRVVAGEFDFHIFRWISTDIIYEMARSGKVHRGNSIVRLHGSEVRYYPYKYNGLWGDTRLTMVSNGHDYHLNCRLGFVVQHIPPMVNCLKIWQHVLDLKKLPKEKLIIAHAPTDPAKKGTEYLARAVKNMQMASMDVELRLIMGKSWEETIKEKAGAHVVFDQISQELGIGTFGLNLVEALAQSKIVVGDPNSWTYSMYPALRKCVLPASSDTLELVLRGIYANRGWWQEKNGLQLNPAGWEFAQGVFDVAVVGQQWLDLITFIHDSVSM